MVAARDGTGGSFAPVPHPGEGVVWSMLLPHHHFNPPGHSLSRSHHTGPASWRDFLDCGIMVFGTSLGNSSHSVRVLYLLAFGHPTSLNEVLSGP
jgi:hypothetical protein